jgi:hypothetical protein
MLLSHTPNSAQQEQNMMQHWVVDPDKSTNNHYLHHLILTGSFITASFITDYLIQLSYMISVQVMG